MVRNFTGTNGNDTAKATKTRSSSGFYFWENWYMAGGFGDDDLTGGDLDDTLHGGGQSDDRLTGGKGNDTYYIDSVNDVITEKSNEGIDTVFSRINHTLDTNFENLYLIPDNRASRGTGNDRNNYIKGSSRNNVLKGMDGNDTVDGDAGNDEIQGANQGSHSFEKDTLIGGSGEDTFVLGIRNKKFYKKSGNLDYATVKDFNINSDELELQGSRSDYLVSGNQLFSQGDLIAVFENNGDASLTFALNNRTNYV